MSAWYPCTAVGSIDPSGLETLADERAERRWGLYRSCEEAREKNTKADVDDGEDARLNPRLAEVIQHLADARADLQVVIDIATVLEDTQQHLSIQHVPQDTAADFQQQQVATMALKKRQIRGIADRLCRGAETLRAKYCCPPDSDAFVADRTELERRWAVQEYKHLGTNFEEDAFVVSIRFHVEDAWTDWLRTRPLGKDTFVIVRDRNYDRNEGSGAGGACAVFEDALTRGWQDIDAQLHRLRSERAWKLVQVALEQEAVAPAVDDAEHNVYDCDVKRAVLELSREHTSGLKNFGSDCVCLDHRMSYVDNFLRSDMCRALFEKRCLLALQKAMTWHLVPDIVRQTTPTRHESFMQQLCAWLSFSAMWYDVCESLDANDPVRISLHAYIHSLASSSHCVPAEVRLGSTRLSIGKEYSMTTDSPGGESSVVGRLQLVELLAARPKLEILF